MGCTQSASPVIATTAVPPYDAVLHTVKTGDLKKLRKILGRTPPLTSEDLESLCVVAAKRGHVLCLEQIANFADRNHLSIKFVAAYYAANINNQLECFDFIVERMPDEHRPTLVVYQAQALWFP